MKFVKVIIALAVICVFGMLEPRFSALKQVMLSGMDNYHSGYIIINGLLSVAYLCAAILVIKFIFNKINNKDRREYVTTRETERREEIRAEEAKKRKEKAVAELEEKFQNNDLTKEQIEYFIRNAFLDIDQQEYLRDKYLPPKS